LTLHFKVKSQGPDIDILLKIRDIDLVPTIDTKHKFLSRSILIIGAIKFNEIKIK